MKLGRVPCALVFLMLVIPVGCSRHRQNANQSQSEQNRTEKATASTSNPQPNTIAPLPPHEKTPEEVWSGASQTTRRSILANRIRSRWKNVRVENSSVVMTVTHPGMDEHGAQEMIGDISDLAEGSGLRRINFVRAGGMCQVTYTRPYCEYACSEQGYCSPSESHPCLTCCIIHGFPISHIPEVREEMCPPHTWVYKVPAH